MLTNRYIADRFLPDKAIDLVDEAAAKLKMEITSKPLALDEIDRRALQLEMERLSLAKAAPKDKVRGGSLACAGAHLRPPRAAVGQMERLSLEKSAPKDTMVGRGL